MADLEKEGTWNQGTFISKEVVSRVLRSPHRCSMQNEFGDTKREEAWYGHKCQSGKFRFCEVVMGSHLCSRKTETTLGISKRELIIK